ncbi:DUF2336 domain-containing protein [Falsiroseomonas sp. CW058]|uniref:DUF2336 domain-containing protein n=1 Tax=Falsiroseomonas sp. CW058 TaxID=3388664 RepID=UPI003D322B88
MSELALRARHGGVAERMAIAGAAATPPELLTWLAADPAPAVRMAVAANRATPPQAGLLLVEDADAAVRGSLARRIAGLAPGLDPAAQDRLARMTGAILARLAEDAVTEVRAIIADAVATLPNVPRDLVLRLARDTELPVAEPVLRLSPLLTDDDLLALVASPPAPFTCSSVAARAELSEAVCDAVAASADSPAIATLLANPSAAIREATLDRLVAGARAEESWQAALVRRPRLPGHTLRALGAMLAGTLLDRLATRADLPDDLACELRARVQARMEEPGHEAVQAALAAGDRDAVVRELASGAGVTPLRIEAALGLRSGRVLAALCWRAGWPAPLAAGVQTLLGVPPRRIVLPNAEGGWALPEPELLWQLELLEDLPA